MPTYLASLVLIVAGCATPTVDTGVRGEPDLQTIDAAFIDVVAWARQSEDPSWFSGWTGNGVVNATDDHTLGLCYEWQELVWDAVRPVAERVGWRADGIAINVATWSQHHAVVVWDPLRIRRDELIAAPPEAPAFVLDAWRRGAPDVYNLADWIDIPLIVMTPPEFEDLRADFGTTPRLGPGVPPRQRVPAAQ